MNKLVTLLMLSISTFHVNAMLYNQSNAHTSGVIVSYTDKDDTYILLTKLHPKEFSNVTSYGPSYQWQGKNVEDANIQLLSFGFNKTCIVDVDDSPNDPLKFKIHVEDYKGPQTFTLFTAQTESYSDPRLQKFFEFLQKQENAQAVITKKLSDFCTNAGANFYKDPNTAELVSIPKSFHQAFREALLRLQPQDAKNINQ